MTENEFVDTFVEPLKEKKLNEIELIFKILTSKSEDKLDEALIFNVKKPDEEMKEALGRVILIVKNAGILIDPETNRSYFENDCAKTKVNTCWYCGSEIETKTNKTFCHTLDCPTGDSNPSAHIDGCCFEEWKSAKKSITQKMNNILKNMTADNQEEIEEKASKIFIDFCDETYRKIYKKLKAIPKYSSQFKPHMIR